MIFWRHRPSRPARNFAEVLLAARHDGDLPPGIATPGGEQTRSRSSVGSNAARARTTRLPAGRCGARDVQTLFADMASGARFAWRSSSQGARLGAHQRQTDERRQVLRGCGRHLRGCMRRRHEDPS